MDATPKGKANRNGTRQAHALDNTVDGQNPAAVDR